MNKICFSTVLAGIMGLLASSASLASDAACSARSPAHRIALLELYTSEGCNSCPPADRWLSSLRQQAGAGELFVPLALHVDYWDRLGWKDIYAQPHFGLRQRELVSAAGNTVVYTPQFFLQGRSIRPGSASQFAAEVAALAKRPAGADIVLTQKRNGADELSLKVEASLNDGQAGSPVSLYIALYQNGLQTRVQAGENRGVTLHHDYVVRRWSGPMAIPAAGRLTANVLFALPEGATPSDFGVVTFVQRGGNEILQTLSRPLCL